MRSAYSAILISSVLLLSACVKTASIHRPEENTGLPRLDQHPSLKVIQVASNFDAGLQRDHPFFIVCSQTDCPDLTVKTPLIALPIVGSATAQKSHDAEGVNTSKRIKTVSILEQFRVHFDYASADVTEDDRSKLKSFVDDYPHDQNTLRVTGFTDSGSTPEGYISNQWLALERATNVKNALITLGYPESKILLEAKFLCCYLESNESEVGRRHNRRTEISLITAVKQ